MANKNEKFYNGSIGRALHIVTLVILWSRTTQIISSKIYKYLYSYFQNTSLRWKLEHSCIKIIDMVWNNEIKNIMLIGDLIFWGWTLNKTVPNHHLEYCALIRVYIFIETTQWEDITFDDVNKPHHGMLKRS